MAKLSRVIQKIFASAPGVNQIGKFGSKAAGAPAFTTDPTQIQSLSNYLTGWFAAVIDGNAPCIEDQNALDFLASYQLAYLFENGVPEWETGTTYYIGSMVNSGGILYISLTDSNIGNVVSDVTKWKPFNIPMTTAGDIIVGASLGAPARLPTRTDGDELSVNSNDTLKTSWVTPASIRNLGLTVSVAANALTIALKTAVGADPSTDSPVVLPFRNATAGTGQFANLLSTAALSIVVPSTTTLGHVSGAAQYVWVYAVNDGGTLRLGVSGVDVFDDLSIQSSTQITTGLTSGSTLYTNGAAVTNKAIRLIGRILITEATAGTWATAPSSVGLLPTPKYNAGAWTDGGAIGLTATSGGLAKGSTSTDKVRYRRDGKDLVAVWSYVQSGTGTAGSGDYLFALPASLVADLSLITAYATVLGNGAQWKPSNIVGDCVLSGSTEFGGGWVSLYDSTHVRAFGMGTASQSVVCAVANWNVSLGNVSYNLEARIPISGWSAFGP